MNTVDVKIVEFVPKISVDAWLGRAAAGLRRSAAAKSSTFLSLFFSLGETEGGNKARGKKKKKKKKGSKNEEGGGFSLVAYLQYGRSANNAK